MIDPQRLGVRVKKITTESDSVCSIELEPIEPSELTGIEAGAHIAVHLPIGVTRSYSLINPPGERTRFMIAVNLDRNSRGGSKYIHEELRVGSTLMVSPARNNFPLVEHSGESILVAGGIGITPIWAMVQQLSHKGRPWQLHYACRTRSSAAFVNQIKAQATLAGRTANFAYDQEPGGKMLDLASIVRASPSDAMFYCCGPGPMLQAFREATAHLPSRQVHLEQFSAAPTESQAADFQLVLAKKGITLTVVAGTTVLQAILDAGIDYEYSCGEGLCGTCEARVLDGIPDHRDSVLTTAQRASNRSMMVCCSGSRSERLVLDI